MVDVIIDGIAEAITREFGEDVRIYDEEREQGVRTPCFFVLSLLSADQDKFGSRTRCSNSFAVQYLPETGRQECYAVRERLLQCLKLITIAGGHLIRATGTLSGEMTGDVLTVIVNYSVDILLKTVAEAMNDLDVKGGVKRDE